MATLKADHTEDSVPFYPEHVTTEAKVVVGIMAVVFAVGILGLLFPVGIGDPADPMNTPMHVKPEWYFLGLYQLLKFIPKTIGAMIPVFLGLLVFIWPFLDNKPETSNRKTRIRFWVIAVGMVILIALTIWGEVS